MKRIGLWAAMLALLLCSLHGGAWASPEPAGDDEWILNSTVTGTEGAQVTLKTAAVTAMTIEWNGKEYRLEQVMTGGDETFPGLYAPLEDPALQSFLKDVGATCTWSGRKDILCIQSRGRDLYFGASASRMKSRTLSLDRGRGFARAGEATCLNLSDLFLFMGFSARPGEISVSVTPAMDDMYAEESGGVRKLVFHTTAPSPFKVVEEDFRHVVLLFPGMSWEVKEGVDTSDFKVSHEPSADGSGTLLRVDFPRNWDGRLLGSPTSDTLSCELMPHFPLLAGYRAESIEGVSAGSGLVIMSATGPLHYFWRYVQDKKMLVLDIPLASKGDACALPPADTAYVKEWTFTTCESGYGASRLCCILQDDVSFSFPESSGDAGTLKLQFSRGAAVSALEGHGATGTPEVCGTIVIDPGHGGCDPGACNMSRGLKEKDLTLDISTRLAKELREKGWKVILTRSSDRDVSWAYSPDRVELQARADVANVNNADAFISIHCNASVASHLSGSSIHWCKESDYGLAKNLQGLLGASLGLKDRGLSRDSFYVLSHTKMPAVLVETAFISNGADAVRLADRLFRERLARTVAQGLDTFMGTRFARTKRPVISSKTAQPEAGVLPYPAKER